MYAPMSYKFICANHDVVPLKKKRLPLGLSRSAIAAGCRQRRIDIHIYTQCLQRVPHQHNKKRPLPLALRKFGGWALQHIVSTLKLVRGLRHGRWKDRGRRTQEKASILSYALHSTTLTIIGPRAPMSTTQRGCSRRTG